MLAAFLWAQRNCEAGVKNLPSSVEQCLFSSPGMHKSLYCSAEDEVSARHFQNYPSDQN